MFGASKLTHKTRCIKRENEAVSAVPETSAPRNFPILFKQNRQRGVYELMKKRFPWVPVLLSALMVGYTSYAIALPHHGKKKSAKIQAVNNFLPFPSFPTGHPVTATNITPSARN